MTSRGVPAPVIVAVVLVALAISSDPAPGQEVRARRADVEKCSRDCKRPQSQTTGSSTASKGRRSGTASSDAERLKQENERGWRQLERDLERDVRRLEAEAAARKAEREAEAAAAREAELRRLDAEANVAEDVRARERREAFARQKQGNPAPRPRIPATPRRQFSPDRDSFSYGYVSANVTAYRGGERIRVRIVSQVDGYCPEETNAERLVGMAQREMRERLAYEFGERYEITFAGVFSKPTREQAEVDWERILADDRYEERLTFHFTALGAMYSQKCK